VLASLAIKRLLEFDELAMSTILDQKLYARHLAQKVTVQPDPNVEVPQFLY